MSDGKNASDIVDLLSALVACPSLNPKVKGVGGIYGEMGMAELVARRIDGWGGQVRIEQVAPQRPNVLARFAGRDRSRTLILEAHLDTVEVEGMTIPPFEPAVRGGRLYGRGSCDTKASIAAMLLAIRRVIDQDGRPPTDVCFAGVCGEELEALGARHLVQGPRPDGIVVGEPTGLTVVTCSKGTYRCSVQTLGLACHSSDPARGVNAIEKMAAVILRLSAPYAESLRTRVHPVLGPPTVSVGTIHGGQQVNAVPDHCRIEIDRRMLPGETAASVEGELRGHLDALAAADPQFRYEFARRQGFEAFQQDERAPLVRHAAGACRKVLGEGRTGGVWYASDASVYGAAGWPCILLGPGDIAQAHTADESVALAQVAAAVDVYAELIRRLQ